MDISRYEEFEGIGVRELEPGILFMEMLTPDPRAAHRNAGNVLREADRDPEVLAVVIGGDPQDYNDGVRKGMRAVADDWTARMEVMQEASDMVYSAINCSKPIIATIPGAMFGLALVADITIATADAVIVDAHIGYGVVAGDHAVMIWPMHCGMAKAKYHLLTGEPLSGAEAERIGLVSLCVEADQLQDKALEIARKLAAGPQRAIRWTKYSLNNLYRTAGPAFDTSLALEFITLAGPDADEGIRALAEGRSPSYKERY